MRRYLVVPAALLVVAALGLAACGDDDDDADSASAAGTSTSVTGTSTSAGAATAEAGDLVAALTVIDGAGFHAIDEALQQPGAVIDPQWLGRVQHAWIAAAAIEWPGQLREDAHLFVEAAESLATMLEADDAAGAAEPATRAHDTGHELSDKGWDYLASEAGIEIGGEHAEEAPVTPETTTSPGTES